MRRTLFTILVAAMFAACGDGSDPELGNGLETETGEESDGLTDETSEEDGEGSDADDGDDTTGEHDTETESTSDSDTGSETEPAGNPGPGDRCDPLLAFDGTAPCETPEGDIYPYTCALVQQNGFGPLKPRCVRLADPQGDGNEWHDKCEAPDIVGDSYTCLNTVCVANNTNPVDPSLGEWMLPSGFCNGVGADEFARCCTRYCEPGAPAQSCGADMKCLAFNPAGLEEGTPPIGYCVDSAYSGG